MMRLKYLVLVLTVLFSVGCEKVNEESPVPKYPVSYSIDYLIYAPILDTQGGYYVVTTPTEYNQYLGFSGLLIFHGFDDRFYAFDLCCPYECNREIRIVPESTGRATCPECGSEYDIGFGTGRPTKGPSTKVLRRYNVSVTGSVVRVTN
ncbi:MAG: hypothetical protein KBT40_01340 [bacterium]|nr:hypothetical protein [Candidatus Minthenecus merdequi]